MAGYRVGTRTIGLRPGSARSATIAEMVNASPIAGRFARGLGRLPPTARVAMLSIGLIFLTFLIHAWRLSGHGASATPIFIPWWAVAIGFWLVELKVIEVHFRRESHAFSLYELPAIIGLFVLAPSEYLLAVGVGSLLALGPTLRTAPIKVAFNIANYLFLAAVSLVVFRALASPGGPPGLDDLVAAFAATLLVTVLGALTIAAAITWSGGAPQFEKLPEMIQFGALVAVANTSVALLAMTLLWTSPAALWLLILPVVTLFLAYRAWVSEREKHERLELVYQSSRILQHSPEIDTALLALLEHARAMFRAELAEVVLDPSGDGRGILRTTSVEGQAAEGIAPIEGLNLEPEVRRQLEARRAGFVRIERTPGGRETPIRQAMVAPLSGESGVIGIITVANRLTEGTAFGRDDLLLLETIANQAAVALENGQLEQSLAELSHLKEQLRYQAYHDPLTDLPNRILFNDRLKNAVAHAKRGGLMAVHYLDLDRFKPINDNHGHQAGDALLISVAQRMLGTVRENDTVARLGGDEFAIVQTGIHCRDDAVVLANRILANFTSPFDLAGSCVHVGVSIGIAIAPEDGATSDDLLVKADDALYRSKSGGRNRFSFYEA